MIGNVRVMIVPQWYAKQRGNPTRRVLAECPLFGRRVCAGHLHQHLATHG